MTRICTEMLRLENYNSHLFYDPELLVGRPKTYDPKTKNPGVFGPILYRVPK